MCKKTVIESPGGMVTFWAGDTYEENRFHLMGDGWVCLVNRFGENSFFAGSFFTDHFAKVAPSQPAPIVRWSAYLTAGLITLGIIIYIIKTWNS